MNGLVQTARELTATALPAEFEALAPPPLLLPGEHLDQYHALRQAIFADLAPRSAIEWLLAIDIAELSWDIQRYRMLRHKLLETYRQSAIEAALRRIDLVGIDSEFEAEAESYTRQNALSWRLDPSPRPRSTRGLRPMASTNTPSPPKSTFRRARSWSCSRGCSTPHKPSAYCSCARSGIRAS
ncbi:hypothetical protein [Bradyrhizobium sp. 177]|uniref:hypothetical protein n=1 Tax=Bradyrhizobium sp. 177 TaxID=2782647 RepID=UPI001FFA90DB|nr:hypothetical protein [Bradyrhizobium sp. 177]